eukprot:COSAG05_NODE_285_length_12188_cov_539.399537_13_plen_296_part_00
MNAKEVVSPLFLSAFDRESRPGGFIGTPACAASRCRSSFTLRLLSACCTAAAAGVAAAVNLHSDPNAFFVLESTLSKPHPAHGGASAPRTLFAPTLGKNGTCVREPTLISIPDSSVLVAVAHRRFWPGDGCSVTGVVWPRPDGDNRTQLVMRRSLDGGRSWQPERMLAYGIGASSVVDSTTRDLVLHFCAAQPGVRWSWASDWCMHEATHGTMYQLRSSDSGATWQRQHIGPNLEPHDGILPSGHATQTHSQRLVFAGQKLMLRNDSFPTALGACWHGSAQDLGSLPLQAWATRM